MSLPVPANYPVVPFVQYHPAQPPFVPNVPCHPNVQHVLPTISAAVANEISIKAQANAVRLFCYNLLVRNNYQNENFAEVVQLSADLIMINLLKQVYRIPEHGVNDVVAQILTMYSSSLVYQYPDLKSMVTPQVLDAAYQNASVFNNLKQEIFSMRSNFPGHHNAPQFQGQYQAPNPGQGHWPVHPGSHMAAGMGYAPPVSNYPNNYNPGYVNPGYGNPGYHSGVTFNPVGAVTTSRFGNSENSIAENLKQDRFFSRYAVHQEPEIQKPDPAPIQVEKPTVSKYLEIEKGSEMDRAKHQISFFGDSFPVDSLVRGQQHDKSADNLRIASVEEEPPSPYLLNSCLLDPSLDMAIASGRMKQFEKQKETICNSAFRCFSIVATPLICTEETKDYLSNLLTAPSFTAMAVKMKAMATALSAKSNEGNQDYSLSLISYLNQINNVLTELVNNFLANRLGIGHKNLNIDNFSEDISELGNYLHRQYGNNYSAALDTFESQVIDCLNEKFDEETLKDLNSNYEIPEGLNIDFLPINYSMTYVPMNDRELGYKVKDKALVIDKVTAPTLHKIAKSLAAHKKQIELETLHDILITADGVRYHLFRNYVADDEYLIAKA